MSFKVVNTTYNVVSFNVFQQKALGPIFTEPFL